MILKVSVVWFIRNPTHAISSQWPSVVINNYGIPISYAEDEASVRCSRTEWVGGGGLIVIGLLSFIAAMFIFSSPYLISLHVIIMDRQSRLLNHPLLIVCD